MAATLTATPGVASEGAPPAAAPKSAPVVLPVPDKAPPMPTPSPEEGQVDMTNPFDQLDAKLTKQKEPAPPPEEKPAPPPAEKPPEKPAEKPAPPPPEDRTITGPKALRDELARVKAEAKTHAEARQKLEAQVKTMEKASKDAATLAEQLAAKDKELETAHATIRALKQEESPEFKEKYDEPFNVQAQFAKETVDGMPLLALDPDTGQLKETGKASFEKEFATLYQMPLGQAIAAANQMFGPNAPIIAGLLKDLHQLDYVRKQALAKEKAKYPELEKQEAAKKAQEREAMSRMWSEVNRDLQEKHADWFAEDPEDKDGNEILSEGFKLVDSFFSNRNAMSLQQRVILDANVRNRAAAFGREVRRTAMLRERVAELEAKIAEMEKSRPGATGAMTGEGAPPEEGDMGDELRQMAGKLFR